MMFKMSAVSVDTGRQSMLPLLVTLFTD